MLYDFLSFADDLIENACSEYFKEPDSVKDIPDLLAREKRILRTTQAGTKIAKGEEAYSLLADAKSVYTKLASWPSENPSRRPCRSYPLCDSINSEQDNVYPRKIDVYYDTMEASACNAWRLGQTLILAVIAKTAAVLGSCSCRDEAVLMANEKEAAERRIREHIDDFCASIPYILYPDNTEAILGLYPHGPDPGCVPGQANPEMICGMSRVKKALEIGSETYCIPHSQRQWMQLYLTLLSRDRRKHQERALRLELTKDHRPYQHATALRS